MRTSSTQVDVVTLGLTDATDGLAKRGQAELRAAVATESLLPDAEAFLRHVLGYLQRHHVALRAEETLGHGYWITKFSRGENGFLEAWEYDAAATGWQPGVTLTLTYWREQHAVCGVAGALFQPPRPDQLAAVSAGVLDGRPVEGVRYPSPEHMSGWWLTTDGYDGDIRSLAVEHLYHVTAARPDLARYLALPLGYRFRSAPEPAVWFDQRAADGA